VLERLGVELRVALISFGSSRASSSPDELVMSLLAFTSALNRGELSFLTRDGESLRDSLEDDGACPTMIGHEAAIIAEFLRGSKLGRVVP